MSNSPPKCFSVDYSSRGDLNNISSFFVAFLRQKCGNSVVILAPLIPDGEIRVPTRNQWGYIYCRVPQLVFPKGRIMSRVPSRGPLAGGDGGVPATPVTVQISSLSGENLVCSKPF